MMHKLASTVVLLSVAFVCQFLCFVARAQDLTPKQLEALNQVAELNQSIVPLKKAGQLDEAIRRAERAVAILETYLAGALPEALASQVKLRADLYFDANQLERAATSYALSVSLWKSVGHRGNLGRALALSGLAELMDYKQQYANSIQLYREALELQDAADGSGSAATFTRFKLGEVYETTGDLAVARGFYEQVVQSFEQSEGANSASLAFALNALGEIYRKEKQYASAEATYRKAMSIHKTNNSEATDPALTIQNNLALALKYQGRFAEAEQVYVAALSIQEQEHGARSPRTLTILGNLAAIYADQNQFSKAEEALERARVIIDETKSIKSHINFIRGRVFWGQGRLDNAEVEFESVVKQESLQVRPDRALESRAQTELAALRAEKARIADKLGAARQLEANNLREFGELSNERLDAVFGAALECQKLNDFGCAEREFGRAFDLAKKGGKYVRAGQYLTQIGALKANRGDASGAEYFERAIREYRLAGRDARTFVASAYGSLARIELRLGRQAEAKRKLDMALNEFEQVFEIRTLEEANVLIELAYDLQITFDDARAPTLLRLALGVQERELGPRHPEIVKTINMLQLALKRKSLYSAALPFAERELEIYEGRYGHSDAQLLPALINLAMICYATDDIERALGFARRAEAIYQSQKAKDHIVYGELLNAFQLIFRSKRMRQNAEAEKYLIKVKELFEPHGPDLQLSNALNSLGTFYVEQNRLSEAIDVLERSLFVERKINNLSASQDWTVAGNLAEAYRRAGRHEDALHLLRKVVDWASKKALVASLSESSAAGLAELRNHTHSFKSFVNVAYKIASQRSSDGEKQAEEAFLVAQWSSFGPTSLALSQMTIRQIADNPGAARSLREYQDLEARRNALNIRLLAAVGRPVLERDEESIRNLQAEIGSIDAVFGSLKTRIDAQLPLAFEAVNPKPMPIEQVQGILKSDEAILFTIDNADESFIWIVTKTAVRWLRLELGSEALRREVGALRCGLDATAWQGDGARNCADLLKMPLGKVPEEGATFPFDAARAHALYVSLLGGARDLIQGKHLLVVPSGALTTLPFQVLVTEPLKSGGSLAEARWLIRDHAITVLPSLSSLAALRRTSRPSSAPKSMIGFANPLLDGNQRDPIYGAWYKQQSERARTQTGCAPTPQRRSAAVRTLGRGAISVPRTGGLADLAHLRMQTPLPETADEVCDVARSLGADVAAMRIGYRATEGAVKRLSLTGELAQYRMLHFATHATLAGQLAGTSEPGLILTPPAIATSEDDGYLSGSEIAALRLDADWVILSACNTAGGAGQGEAAEALSGLARVFFYAGARALLVSHWEVDSAAAVKLVTGAVGALAKDPAIGRAEALRRATLAAMSDTTRPANWTPAWHPAVWAPFVVVGEGGAGR